MTESIITSFLCPVCKVPMYSCIGGKLNTAGITIYCVNKECSSQEVIGYGSNVANAYEIVKDKYQRHIKN